MYFSANSVKTPWKTCGVPWSTGSARKVAIPGRLSASLEDTDTGRIETGWRVDTAAGHAMPERVLLKQSRDYTKQRKASDI